MDPEIYEYIWIFPSFLALGFATPLLISCSMVTGLSTVFPHQRGIGDGILGAFGNSEVL